MALVTELTLRCQPIRQARNSLRLDGSLEALEAWRAELLRTSFTPEYCAWIKTDSDAWHLKIGVASVSDQAVNEQIAGLQSLAEQHQRGTEQQTWLDVAARPLIEALKQQFDPKQQLARGQLPGVSC